MSTMGNSAASIENYNRQLEYKTLQLHFDKHLAPSQIDRELHMSEGTAKSYITHHWYLYKMNIIHSMNYNRRDDLMPTSPISRPVQNQRRRSQNYGRGRYVANAWDDLNILLG